MHYVEIQLDNKIKNKKIKPQITTGNFDFKEAFFLFLEEIDIEFDSLYEGKVEALDSTNTKFKTSFAISYGQYTESSSIYMTVEKSGMNWIYTFTDVRKGVAGGLTYSKSEDDEEEDDDDYNKIEENGTFSCSTCGEDLGEVESYGMDFSPSAKSRIKNIRVEEVFDYGDPMIELRIDLICKSCKSEHSIKALTYEE